MIKTFLFIEDEGNLYHYFLDPNIWPNDVLEDHFKEYWPHHRYWWVEDLPFDESKDQPW